MQTIASIPAAVNPHPSIVLSSPNPMLALQQVFNTEQQPSLHQCLWQWHKTTITGSFAYINTTERETLLATYERLLHLVEAAQQLYNGEQERKQGPATTATQKAEQPVMENELPPTADALLNNILNCLLQKKLVFDRIYLLQRSFEAGMKKPMYDLLVLIPPGSLFTHQQYCERIHNWCEHLAHVNAWVYKYNAMATLLEQGHIWFGPRCIPENAIYDNGRNNWPTLGKITSIQEQVTQVSARFWQQYNTALAFREDAQLHLQKQQLPMAAFMSHQCIELCCRAVILPLTGNNLHGHNLVKFLHHANTCLYGLHQYFTPHTAEQRALLQLLNAAYTRGRYGGLSVGEEQLTEILTRISNLLDAAPKLLMQQLEPLTVTH